MSALPPHASTFFTFPPIAGFFRREAPVPRRAIEPTMGPSARTAPSASPGANNVDVDRMLAAARVAPQLEMLEWDDQPAPGEAPLLPPAAPGNDPRSFDARRRKIRDRYIATRFSGVASCSTDLESSERVIKSARLYFEEERNDAALELLELAIEECPRERSLWLARLEILFLLRDARGFLETACDFYQEHPDAGEAWAEVCRLGRALVPGEALFGARSGPRDHEHYGPWPHTPNWIQAPWDLTAEIVAADFHRAVARQSA